MEKKFRKGEVVWAKVRGFPWWPAMVKAVNIKISREDEEEEENEVKEITVLVYFIGDDTHSDLPINKVEKFNTKFEEYSRTKKKSLLTSITIAQKIILGEIPFENHLQYAKMKKILHQEENKLIDRDHDDESVRENNYKSNKINKNIVEDSEDESPKNFIGLKKRRKFNKLKAQSKPRVDLRVNDDEFSNNIKINININVNNNTNNTLNFTTVEKNITNEKKNENENYREKLIKPITNFKRKDKTEVLNKQVQLNENFKFNDRNPESSNHNSDSDSKEELAEAVNNLIFYKIDMSTTSCNRSIINSLELIESKLVRLNNCNVYMLIKDLIPILTSFFSNKNEIISTKSTELISAIKEKVLSEIFEFEKDNSKMTDLLIKEPEQEIDRNSIQDLFSDINQHLLELNEKNNQETNILRGNVDKVYGRLKRTARKISNIEHNDNDTNNHNLFKSNSVNWNGKEQFSDISEKFLPSDVKPVEIMIENPRENDNISIPPNIDHKFEKANEPLNLFNENNYSMFDNIQTNNNSKLFALNRNSAPSFSSNQIRLLLKDFIYDENDNSDFKEKLNKGYYSEQFYKNVYNKHNGLSESLAFKRKHVCQKLLNILKLILPEIDTETLKKTIIFIEYNIRTNDPTFGNIYKKKLEAFYDKLKDILSITTDSINTNLNKNKNRS